MVTSFFLKNKNITMMSRIDLRQACGCSFFLSSLVGLVRVCEIEMGKTTEMRELQVNQNADVSNIIKV